MSNYSEYDELLNRINSNLSASDTQFGKVSDAAPSDCDINVTLENFTNMQVVKNNAGDVIGYDYVHTYQSSPNTTDIAIDSNNDEGRFFGGGQTKGGGAGRYSGSYYDSQGELKSGAVDNQGNQINTLSGYVSPQWSAVSVLAKLGINVSSETAQNIDQLGTNVANTFMNLFTKVGLLPEEYANAARTLYHVDSQGNTTMYMDEDTIGALAIQARDDGFFEEGGSIIPSEEEITIGQEFQKTDFVYMSLGQYCNFVGGGLNQRYAECASNIGVLCVDTRGVYYLIASWTPGVDRYIENGPFIVESYGSGSNHKVGQMARNPIPIFSDHTSDGGGFIIGSGNTVSAVGKSLPRYLGTTNAANLDQRFLVNAIEQTAIPGTSHQSGAIIPVDAITGADPHVVAQNLATNYPTVMGDPITITVMDVNCQPVTKKYYSVPISYSPTNVGVNAPITGGLQVNPSFNPDVGIDLPDIDMSKYVEEIMNQLSGTGAGRDIVKTSVDGSGLPVIVPLLPTIPNTGEGDAPDPVMPQVGDTPLWHVYNPTSAEARAFGAWLWSSNIIDQIIRIFQNPLDGVIGLHAIYAQPSTSGSANIVCGNVTSNVAAAIVNSQYISVNCGFVWLTEYFGNVFDYSPYTSVSLFLPFIGIVPLNVADVMRAKLSITYNIDVYTGACIAMINVERDSYGGVIYQFSGNCAVSFPTSAVTYNSIFSSMISIAAGIATAVVASSNPATIGGAAAAAHGVFSAKQDVSKSGAFTANAGAMGPKKPYLIITRPQTNMALNYEEYDGRGANQTVMLKDIHGYARCKIVHLNIPQAFGDELKEIHDILTTGVILP